ncbi:MAG TPA: acyloxyacyl hydrolase [Chthoniobacteraceae bacterium]|jgi:opacity protein-like surface antigen|nr:acyloxyacyl hydrolase [Chthoniobacteraceae bacterium]
MALAGHPTGETISKSTTIESAFPFTRGTNEAEVGVGTYWSIGTKGDAERPNMAFGVGAVSYGWMISDIHGDGICRGNWEFLLSAFGGGIFDGPGDKLAGGGFAFRYNFVRPDAAIIPFIQLGAGGVYSDAANDDAEQRLLGSDWSFDLQGGLGLRFMTSERFAITLKADYRHFSNAGIADRNHGLNNLGGVLGMSFFY